jgi:hypothetical protein
MRNIQTTKEQSELRRLSQACFHLLAFERENICDLVLPNCAYASSRGGEHCTDNRLVTEKMDICPVVNTFGLHDGRLLTLEDTVE